MANLSNLNNLVSLSCLSLNCQGLRDVSKRSAFFSWLTCVKADVICLQETHSTSSDEFLSWVSSQSDSGNNPLTYSVVSSPGTPRSRGVAILFRPCLRVDQHYSDADGRLQVVQFSSTDSDSSSFQLINLYGPNRKVEGEAFFESIMPHIDSSLPSFVCGDFNTVVNPVVDRHGCNPSSPWAYNWPISLSALTRHFDLVDIWRVRHPDERNYTWRRANGSQASRLDMFWLSSHLVPSVLDVAIYPFFRSDHSYVFLRVTLPSAPARGPGVWKFNSSLLSDDVFTAKVRAFWSSWQAEKSSFPNVAVWWDAGKSRLKRLMRQYSREQASSRRSRIRSLERTLLHLNRRENNGDDVAHFISETKASLELEYAHRAHGAQLRAKERWAEEGETSSSYFFRLEKTKAVRKLFTGIRNAQGVIVRSVSAIIRVWCIFYVQLFSAAILSPSDQDFFLDSLDLSLSDREAGLCEGEVTLEECLSALNSFKRNKSPGIDGLPYEFYQCFWDILSNDLVDVYNDCLSRGSLSFSQRTGLITLLYKKNDKLDTKNWRPISLLCTDYKILAKVLTNRLKLVLSTVVSPSQTCGVPGRFSGEHVRLLQDIVNFSNTNNVGAAILSLDQEKAFDRVDWSFMLKVLERMNFGPSFRSWVQLLYSSIFSRVLVNGYTSEAFRVTRGVRQGCPLSPLLYILVAETISSAIKKDPLIDGFSLPDGQRVKIFQYADDTSILVQSDQAMTALFSLFERYERASGAKLNVTKSHGLLLGSWKDRVVLPIQLNWSNNFITVLGCRISNDDSVDWASLIERFSGQLALWKHRQLSFRGRALICNMLGLSIFWYQATVFDMPKTVIHAINKILFPFVWRKKREWMARTSVTQPLSEGGLGIVDVSRKVASLRAVWWRRFFTPSPHPWSVFCHYYVNVVFQCPPSDVLVRDNIPAYRVRKLPSFYASLLRVWQDLRGRKEQGFWVIPRPSGAPLPISELTTSLSYSFLSRSQHVDHRSLMKFRDLGIDVRWPQVWASLRLWRFVRSVQDTSWLSFHGILPTSDRLVRFGMRVNPSCFCGLPEDLLHLLTSCRFAREVLAWFLSRVQEARPSISSLTSSQILFGFATESRVPLVYSALLGVLRHHIWLSRNNQRFEDIAPDVGVLLHKAKSTFRFLVRMHKRHCPRDRFVREWLADGSVGTLTVDDWIHFSRGFVT